MCFALATETGQTTIVASRPADPELVLALPWVADHIIMPLARFVSLRLHITGGARRIGPGADSTLQCIVGAKPPRSTGTQGLVDA